jgi:hypothetical protein
MTSSFRFPIPALNAINTPLHADPHWQQRRFPLDVLYWRTEARRHPCTRAGRLHQRSRESGSSIPNTDEGRTVKLVPLAEQQAGTAAWQRNSRCRCVSDYICPARWNSPARPEIFLCSRCLSHRHRYEEVVLLRKLGQYVDTVHAKPGNLEQTTLSFRREFHAKCGGLPINLSIIFPACTVDGVGQRRQLHSHFQIRRDLSGYTIRKSEGSRTPDGSIGVAYHVPYKNVNEKLLHLSHLLSIGSPRVRAK